MPRGKFIAIEGIDGSGKTTMVNLVVSQLALAYPNRQIIRTKEPDGILEFSKEIRKMLMTHKISAVTQTMLLFAARYENILETIGPALEAGHIVITDRWTASTFAYQGVGAGVDFSLIQMLSDYSNTLAKVSINPDMVFVLDIPVKTAIDRVNTRSGLDLMEQQYLDKLSAMREYYQRLVYKTVNKDEYPITKYSVIDNQEDPKVALKEIFSLIAAQL